MPHTILQTPSAAKQLKKLNPSIQKLLIEQILHLTDNPLLGIPLTGEFKHLRSFHLHLAKNQYRVVYHLDETDQQVIIYAVGKRGDFYQRLRQMNLKVA